MAIRSANDLVAAADAAVVRLRADQAVGLVGDPSVLFVDLREADEVEASGMVAGAVHVPRGVLEFIVDPASPRHRAEFSSGRRIVLYCAGGGRSALAAKALQDMGVDEVAHVTGGFAALKDAGVQIGSPASC